MSSKISATNEGKIYRYTFTEKFQKKLIDFTSIHKFDDATIFREYWDEWLIINNNEVLAEIRTLQNKGYTGDAKSKMYKSVRYYYKDKTDKKTEPKKRRVYISLERDILDAMDNHIDKNKTMKPAAAYIAFYNNDNNKTLLTKTLNNIINSGLDKADADFKLKKTYKNRFFLKK